MPGPALDALTAALAEPATRLREARLDRRRGHRPRQHAPGTGPRPLLTTADLLLATILRDRHHLPLPATAALCHVHADTLSKNTSQIRRLLTQTGHTIQPAPRKLTNLASLYTYATDAGITLPAEPQPAC